MRRIIICLTAILISVSALSQTKERLDAVLIDAVQDYNNEDFIKASGKLLAIVEVDSTYDAAYYYLSMCAYYLEDSVSASRYARRAASLDPGNKWYAQLLDFLHIPALLDEADQCRLAKDMDGFFKRMTDFAADREVRTEPKCKYITSSLGLFDRKAFNTYRPQIEDMMSALISSDPESPETHSLAMQVYMMYDDDGKVISECEKIIAIHSSDPSEAVAYVSVIGDVYYEAGNRKKAYEAYKRALKMVPDYAPVLNNYAYYLSQEGRQLRKALKMSALSLEKEPDNATYLDTYGWILHLLGRDSEAKPYFKHAMLYGGKDSKVVLEHYASVLESLGENELASYYKVLSENK